MDKLSRRNIVIFLIVFLVLLLIVLLIFNLFFKKEYDPQLGCLVKEDNITTTNPNIYSCCDGSEKVITRVNDSSRRRVECL
jgi:flagellar basal body-associated protein FliL